jgi:hypothetical protein
VWHAQRFQAAPTAEGVAVLSQTLVATRAELRRVGALPPDQEYDPLATVPAARRAVTEQSGLVCVGLDGHWSGRAMHTMFFEQCLGADMSRSRSMGQDAHDEEAFVDVALGRLDVDLRPVPADEQRHVDAVLLNQHIRFAGSQHGVWDRGLRGSDLAEELYVQAFRGVVCIVTSLNPAALAHVRTLPGVDLALSKGTPHSEIASRLQEAIEANHEAVRARLSDFLRKALRTTNAIAALLQQGTDGVNIAEARQLVTELAEAARRECLRHGTFNCGKK